VAYGEARYSGTVNAGGTLTITFGPNGRGRLWRVNQVSVEMATAPGGATCTLYRQGSFVDTLVATGGAATLQAIVLRDLATCTITWALCTPGDQGNVLVIYDDGKK